MPKAFNRSHLVRIKHVVKFKWIAYLGHHTMMIAASMEALSTVIL
jgi:hypothetical protein